MQLNRIDDPRDILTKSRQSEIWRFAKTHGITEITHDMWAIQMRKVIRSKGLTRAFIAWARTNVPDRPLGASNQPNSISDAGTGEEIDMDADLARQWQQQQTQHRPAPAAPVANGINELRAECKRLGIKLGRTDNMKTMREKIEAHLGQNAS